jgi:hypothetical protein
MWHWQMLFSEYFGLPQLLLFHQFSMLYHHVIFNTKMGKAWEPVSGKRYIKFSQGAATLSSHEVFRMTTEMGNSSALYL